MYFDRFDRDAGLSQLAVHSIAEDRTGYLWLGTEDGFDRYDGYTFQRAMNEAPEFGRLSSTYVADIAVDDRDSLWLATDGDGVLRRDPLSGRLEALADRVENRAAIAGLERVRAMQFDQRGMLWIGSRNAGIAKFDPQTRKLERFRARNGASGLSNDSILALFEDRGGTIWAGTDAGLDRFDSLEHRFIPQSLPLARRSPARAVLQDYFGSFWVGTAAGLVRLDGATRAPTLYVHDAANARSLPSDSVNALLQDRAGRLWVGTSAGLALFDRATGTFDVYRNDPSDSKSLPDDNVISLLEDRNGLLWIGTQFGGLAKWNPRTWSFGHDPARVEAGFVGHATVAAHYVLSRDRARTERVRQKSKAGIVEIDVRGSGEDRRIAIRQPRPPVGRELNDRERMAVLDALALATDDLDLRCPIRIAGAGSTRLMVGVRGPDQLKALKPDSGRLTTLSAQLGAAGYFIFTLAPHDAEFFTESRMFCPALGIPEDPVSGNAHGLLGAYFAECGLLKHDGKRATFSGTQGHHLHRPGRVDVELEFRDGHIDAVWIIGQAVSIFETVITL